VREAESAVGWARESTRFNPRWLLSRRRRGAAAPAAFESAMDTLREVSTQLQRFAEALADETSHGRAETGHGFSDAIAALLESLAKAVSCYRVTVEGNRLTELEDHLHEACERREELAARLRDGRPGTTVSRTVEGAILLALRRALRALSDDHASRRR
jgi:hypothetical protein